jgi:hypothetical protein
MLVDADQSTDMRLSTMLLERDKSKHQRQVDISTSFRGKGFLKRSVYGVAETYILAIGKVQSLTGFKLLVQMEQMG